MFVGEFEGLDQSQSFVDVSADREVINSDLAEDSFAINDEKATECHAILLFVDLIGLKKKITMVTHIVMSVGLWSF